MARRYGMALRALMMPSHTTLGEDMADAATINNDQLSAIVQLANVLNDGMLASDLAEKLSCCEVEPVAEFLRAFGHKDAAETWLAAHADGDEEGDWHFEA